MYDVYLVDDDPFILDELLSSIPWLDNGYAVVGHANSSSTALEEIAALQPTLVIADLKMEPFDGIELMRKVKELGLTCYFLMISGYGSFENSRQFFLEGGFDYILKPIVPHEVQLVLDRLYQALTSQKAERSSLKGCNPAFVDMLAYLETNFRQKHSLESLGKQFGLSPNYICTLFTKHCDTTLVHHITHLRMAAAKKGIEEGVSLKEIASQCGYNDYYYFCRVFKEHYGVSPGKYGTEEANE